MDALAHEINTAMIGVINGFERIVLRPVPVIECRKRMQSRPAEVQFSSDVQHRIADGLGVQPATVEMPE